MNVTRSKYATLTEYHVITEAVGALRLYLVATNQVASDAVIDMIVDRPVGNQSRAVAEVCAPTAQKPVQLVSHLRPWRLIAGNQDRGQAIERAQKHAWWHEAGTSYAARVKTCVMVARSGLKLSVWPFDMRRELYERLWAANCGIPDRFKPCTR